MIDPRGTSLLRTVACGSLMVATLMGCNRAPDTAATATPPAEPAVVAPAPEAAPVVEPTPAPKPAPVATPRPRKPATTSSASSAAAAPAPHVPRH